MFHVKQLVKKKALIEPFIFLSVILYIKSLYVLSIFFYEVFSRFYFGTH